MERKRCKFADTSRPRSSSSHNLCLFFHIPFLVSYFLCGPLSFLCALSLLCAICLPSASPVMPQMAFVKDGGDHREFLSIWPQCALHLPLTAWSITHKCFLLLFGNRLPAQGSARLSELLSSLPWASAGNKSTSCICISSVSHHCKVHSTSKHVGVFFVCLFCCVCLGGGFQKLCNNDAPGSSTGCL